MRRRLGCDRSRVSARYQRQPARNVLQSLSWRFLSLGETRVVCAGPAFRGRLRCMLVCRFGLLPYVAALCFRGAWDPQTRKLWSYSPPVRSVARDLLLCWLAGLDACSRLLKATAFVGSRLWAARQGHSTYAEAQVRQLAACSAHHHWGPLSVVLAWLMSLCRCKLA